MSALAGGRRLRSSAVAPGFGLAHFLVVGDLRDLLPALGVARRIFVQPADDALGAFLRESHIGKIAMEGGLAPSGSLTGTRSAMGEFC